MVAEVNAIVQRYITVLDAPSNLGLRPPDEGAAPGCYKMPWALRNRGLISMLSARDAGTLIPPRYYATWEPGGGTRNAEAIAAYSRRLAQRVGEIVGSDAFPLVVGGDCSILLGNMLALKRRGRYGLVFIDGHSDFRHPGNADAIGAAAGEDLAILTGRGDERLIDLSGRGPAVAKEDVAVIGIRPDDVYREELAKLGIAAQTCEDVAGRSSDAVADQTLEIVTRGTDGFWVHLDFDVVDAKEMPAVDSPALNGLSFTQLEALVRPILAAPDCVGMELTIYDPDLDPDGQYGDAIGRFLEAVFARDSSEGLS